MSVLKFCSNPRFSMFGFSKCGKCPGCLRMRQREWMSRAFFEGSTHPRTWFLTLTYRGSVEIGYAEVQKFLKRVRKKRQLRFFCATEKGERNGRLHFHLLVHCDQDVGKRELKAHWTHGFSDLRLVDVKSLLSTGRYVAKYLAKGGRLRASVGYGTNRVPEFHSNALVAEVLRVFPGSYVSAVDGVRVPYRHALAGRRAAVRLLADGVPAERVRTASHSELDLRPVAERYGPYAIAGLVAQPSDFLPYPDQDEDC